MGEQLRCSCRSLWRTSFQPLSFPSDIPRLQHESSPPASLTADSSSLTPQRQWGGHKIYEQWCVSAMSEMLMALTAFQQKAEPGMQQIAFLSVSQDALTMKPILLPFTCYVLQTEQTAHMKNKGNALLGGDKDRNCPIVFNWVIQRSTASKRQSFHEPHSEFLWTRSGRREP